MTLPGAHRYQSLDSLRGLAALVVVLHHLSLAVPGTYGFLHKAWLPRILIAGHQAVAVFFVLSGFVLYVSLMGERRPVYGLFVAKAHRTAASLRRKGVLRVGSTARRRRCVISAVTGPVGIRGQRRWRTATWPD